MAIIDSKSLVVDGMHFFTAEVDTVVSDADLKTIAKGVQTDGAITLSKWEDLGHTSLDAPLKLTTEGGEVTTLGSLQNHALRTRTSDKIRSLEIDSVQFDEETIKMFLGANTLKEANLLWEQTKATPVQKAFLGVAVDGDGLFVIHGPKVDITANGDLDASNAEELAKLPLKFTFLKSDKAKGAFAITPVLSIKELAGTTSASSH
ncbi:MAG: hypothetical protein E6451_10980 [Enterococcus faecalis]|jgi:hypothetical protein|nr:hypothetical protein [Enterococcus faecalis]